MNTFKLFGWYLLLSNNRPCDVMKCLKCMRKIADPKTGLCDDCSLEAEDSGFYDEETDFE